LQEIYHTLLVRVPIAHANEARTSKWFVERDLQAEMNERNKRGASTKVRVERRNKKGEIRKTIVLHQKSPINPTTTSVFCRDE
jgi:hypothetical protein